LKTWSAPPNGALMYTTHRLSKSAAGSVQSSGVAAQRIKPAAC
jgi:hypothetical protein